MTRRTTSMVVAAVTLGVLVTVALVVKMPYVIMSPGLTENTLGDFEGQPVIEIEGHQTYPTEGRLDLTTVSVTKPSYRPRLAEVLSAWWSSEQAVLPEEAIYPEGQTVAEAEQEKQQQMMDSQSTAIVAGLELAGFDAIDVTVDSVQPGMPADGKVRPGDIIESVNGEPVRVNDDVIDTVTPLPVGSPVTLGVERGGELRTLRMTTAATDDGTSRVGINLRTPEVFDPPFKVNIDTGQEIGGPSAGLMFSLGIYDKLTPGPLTNGGFVAGTGTIDAAGLVGSIGGIQQKLAAAHSAGAEIFLVPADNCTDAVSSEFADDMELIRVTAIDDAASSLEAFSSGETDDIPRCEG